MSAPGTGRPRGGPARGCGPRRRCAPPAPGRTKGHPGRTRMAFHGRELGPFSGSRGEPSACRRWGRTSEAPADPGRSEEHTSELQSRFDLVCRLLLEKKKTTMYISSEEVEGT